jgi:RecB family exonuclease
VLGLKEKKELPEDPEGREIGSFIHELLKDTFAVFLNKKPVIDEMFRRNFFAAFDKKFGETFKKRMRSDSFLLKDVMKFRLERFLDSEAENNEKKTAKIISLEQKLEERLELSGDVFNFTYIMDRLDRLEDKSLLIIDYKTGSDTPKPKQTGSLEKMELNRESIRDTVRSFQLPLYYHFEKKRCREETLDAALYNLRNLKLTFLSGKNTDIGRTEEICLKALDFIIHEIIDPEKMFEADSGKENYCKNCPFNC